jgi:diguanylate cyclase (GGDEF)-like protein/PAS domain S-box-containing protein
MSSVGDKTQLPAVTSGPDLSFTAGLVGQLVVPTFALDATGKVILWNPACERLTAMSAEDVIGTRNHWRAFYGVERPCLADLVVRGELDGIDQLYPIYHQTPENTLGIHAENWCVMPLLGTRLYLEIDVGIIHDDQGKLIAVVETLRDMTLRQSAENRLRTLFDQSPDPVWIIENGMFVECNEAAVTMLGYSSKIELMDTHPSRLSPPIQPDGEDSFRKAERMMALACANGTNRFEWVHTRADGSDFTAEVTLSAIELGGRQAIYCAWQDISERKLAKDRIEYLAHFDSLTGLANRFSLNSRLAQTLLEAKREERLLAVMFIDLDRFKMINDTLGHHIGDLLLVETASRLDKTVRKSDIVARLGGDEFVVVLTMLTDPADAAHLASKMIEALGAPYQIEGKELHSTPSIGISIFPNNGDDPDILMKHADAAMYSAKDHGRNNFKFFSASMTEAASERMEIERDLRQALKVGQFELHYQPQICTRRNDKVCGVEALVRWRHPERGLIPPLKFIPIAEETGVIEELGLWVLNEACRQLAVWRNEGIKELRMAVNLSAHQLRSADLVESVRDAIKKYSLKEGDLELEVTESTAMTNPEWAIGQLKALRDLGVELAIDDFGTGYSSLAYLKLLPIHTLKLDRAFVSDIETDENDAAISAATIALAHSLGLKVVAEGIETEGQSRFLREHGCDMLQGYLYGRPEPAAALSERWKKIAQFKPV